jgi:hypothetical protein
VETLCDEEGPTDFLYDAVEAVKRALEGKNWPCNGVEADKAGL